MKNKSSKFNLNDNIDNLSDKYTNAVSTTDCTGLMPSDPKSKAEVDSYKEIYNFQVPIADDQEQSSEEKNQNK